MSPLPSLRLASLPLVLSVVACSTGLSPYADYPEPDGDERSGEPSAAATGTIHPASSANPSAPAVAPPLPPRASANPTSPPPATPPLPPVPVAVPSSEPSQPLPSCAIHNLTVDCPSTAASLPPYDLPCRNDQLGQRCAYASDGDRVNLLECVASEDGRPGPRWASRQARCSRSCLGDFPHSFLAFAMSNCAERPLYPCDGAATDQDAVDDALKNIQRQCGAPSSMVLGLLLGEDGCGRALFIEDKLVGECAAEALTHLRFGCAPRCASTKETGHSIIE